MDVNTTVERVGVFHLHTAQPDNARNHRITAGCVWLQNFSREPSIVEDGASRSVIPDFLRHLEQTGRCCH